MLLINRREGNLGRLFTSRTMSGETPPHRRCINRPSQTYALATPFLTLSYGTSPLAKGCHPSDSRPSTTRVARCRGQGVRALGDRRREPVPERCSFPCPIRRRERRREQSTARKSRSA